MDTTTEVLDPRFDDGTRITVDLANPPDWLDVEALYREAAEAGDLELCRMIEHVKRH